MFVVKLNNKFRLFDANINAVHNDVFHQRLVHVLHRVHLQDVHLAGHSVPRVVAILLETDVSQVDI